MISRKTVIDQFGIRRLGSGRVLGIGFLAIWFSLVAVIILFGSRMSSWLLYPLIALTLICIPDSASIISLFKKSTDGGEKDQSQSRIPKGKP